MSFKEEFESIQKQFVFNVERKLKYASGIYAIKNSIDHRIYIGSAKEFYKRYSTHAKSLFNQLYKNTKLQNFYNKYGFSNLEFVILELVDKRDDLLKREQFYFDLYEPFDKRGFNINRSSTSGIGRKPSQKEIEALVKRVKGNTWTKGLKYNQEICEGRSRSYKTWIPVAQYDMYGKFIKVYDSDYSAAKEINLKEVKQITKVCNLINPSCCGFIWRYAPDYITPNRILTKKKCIIQLSIEGCEVKRYEKLSEIGHKNGYNMDLVHKVCMGWAKTHKGFCWKYENECVI